MSTKAKLSLHPKDGRPILAFASSRKWEAWLKQNHNRSPGIWIKFAKKGTGISTVVYAEALDVALCHGWIDSQAARLDETFYLQRFTPRGPRSKWSKINCAKVQKLIESGKMTERGMKEIEAAKADGRWEQAYDGQCNMPVPPDFQKALEKSPRAAKFFEQISKANRYAILYRIHDAKKPATRARRIEQIMTMLKAGETFH